MKLLIAIDAYLFIMHFSIMRDVSLNHHKSSQGFSAIEALFVLAVIVTLSLGGLYVWHHSREPNVTSRSSSASSNSQTASTPPADPYAGWKTATLAYEKATFKYPSTWILASDEKMEGGNGMVAPGADAATLTSPDGLVVSLRAGVTGTGDGFGTVLSSESITTLGAAYHLDFYTNDPVNQLLSQGACVGTIDTSQANYPYSKNIQLMNTAGKPFDVLCLNYAEDINGDVPEKTVATFVNDPSYMTAKLIIKSLTY